jgi:hypothetical protein
VDQANIWLALDWTLPAAVASGGGWMGVGFSEAGGMKVLRFEHDRHRSCGFMKGSPLVSRLQQHWFSDSVAQVFYWLSVALVGL